MTATLAKIGATALVNFDDVDPITRDEITDSLTRFRSEFPRVADALQEIRVGGPEFDRNPGGYAFTQADGFGRCVIGLNPVPYGPGGRSTLERHAREDFDLKYHGYWQPAGVVEHELFHVIDMTLGGYGFHPSDALTSIRDAASVSEYAIAGGPGEAMADAFGAWRVGMPYGNRAVRELLDGIVSVARHA